MQTYIFYILNYITPAFKQVCANPTAATLKSFTQKFAKKEHGANATTRLEDEFFDSQNSACAGT